MQVGEQLKYYREQNRLSQQDVADRLETSRQSISRWETDKCYPDLDNLVLLSKLYQVTLDELLGEEICHINKEEHKAENAGEEKESGGIDRTKQETLFIILIVSCLIPLLGAVVSSVILIKKWKQLHVVLKITCVICFLLSVHNCFVEFNAWFYFLAKTDITVVT